MFWKNYIRKLVLFIQAAKTSKDVKRMVLLYFLVQQKCVILLISIFFLCHPSNVFCEFLGIQTNCLSWFCSPSLLLHSDPFLTILGINFHKFRIQSTNNRCLETVQIYMNMKQMPYLLNQVLLIIHIFRTI